MKTDFKVYPRKIYVFFEGGIALPKGQKGSFGVNTLENNSPLYVIQRIKGSFLLCSTRFDDPPCSWVTIHKEDFWTLV